MAGRSSGRSAADLFRVALARETGVNVRNIQLYETAFRCRRRATTIAVFSSSQPALRSAPPFRPAAV